MTGIHPSRKRIPRPVGAAARTAKPRGASGIGAVAGRAGSLGGFSLGALAVGAVSVGAGAVFALAIRRLAIRHAVIRELNIHTLRVRRLEVGEVIGPSGAGGWGALGEDGAVPHQSPDQTAERDR
jgi:hypothetical protein